MSDEAPERRERPEPTAWEAEHVHDPADYADAHTHLSGPRRARHEVQAIRLLAVFDDAQQTPESFLAWDDYRRAFLAALNWNPAEPPEAETDNPHAMRWG